MREIKFRGKRVDNGEWVYGYYLKNKNKKETTHIIITRWQQIYGNSFEVIYETVGQAINRRDKNKKSIYDGDIINNSGAYVSWNDETLCWCFRFKHDRRLIALCRNKNNIFEVIGNINDNPELMK